MKYSKGTEWIKSVLSPPNSAFTNTQYWWDCKNLIPGRVSFSPWLNEQFLVTALSQMANGIRRRTASSGHFWRQGMMSCTPLGCTPPTCTLPSPTPMYLAVFHSCSPTAGRENTNSVQSEWGRGEKGKGDAELLFHSNVKIQGYAWVQVRAE